MIALRIMAVVGYWIASIPIISFTWAGFLMVTPLWLLASVILKKNIFRVFLEANKEVLQEFSQKVWNFKLPQSNDYDGT